MKMKKILSLLLALCLALLPLGGCSRNGDDGKAETTPTPTPHPEYELTDTALTKDESVYINLSSSGEVRSVSVTDKLHVDMPQVRVADKSSLSDIADVRGYNSPVISGDTLYWDMDSTDLYYSGGTDSAPPLSISVAYTLDGKELSADELAGKSGALEIKISVRNSLVKAVGGYEISCPMLFVGGMLLPNESFSEVSAPEGVVLGDGTRQLVFFAGVPGMNESLGLSELGVSIGDALGTSEYTVTAQVENFSLGNMMFAAVPFSSVSVLGPDSLSAGFDDIETVLSEIQQLIGSYSSLNLADTVQLLYGDAQQIESLMNSVGEAAKLYEENKALIDLLDKYCTEENLAQLEQLLYDMEQIDTSRLTALSQYTHLNELLELLGKFDGNIAALAQFSRDYLSIAPLFESLSADLNSPEVQQSIDNLPQIISELRSLVDTLNASRAMLDRMTSLLDGDSLDRIIGFAQSLESSESIKALTQAQRQALGERLSAWLDFGQSYDIFTARTDSTSSTVIFVYKTEAVG